MTAAIQELLERKVAQYNQPSFIEKDPISIPHRFRRKQDIEIMGFWTAVLAWGQRPVILKKAAELIDLMDGAPHDFVRNHEDHDLKRFLAFKHRTFNATDTLYFLHFFRDYYRQNESLEDAFVAGLHPDDPTTENALKAFHDRFCGCSMQSGSVQSGSIQSGSVQSGEFFPERTRKHIATPARNASCKRLNMFLRWMVRRDDKGVDFGLWTRIRPAQLVMPVDVHVGRVARTLRLLRREQTDWRAALELTETLRLFDPADPVKYDFALFGLGVEGEM